MKSKITTLHLLDVLALLATSLAAPVANSTSGCKCSPSDPCWPSPSAWQTLNTTLSGALIATVPIASVCYPDWPDFNLAACASISSQWNSSKFHSSDPASIMWTDWASGPDAVKGPCEPTYGVPGAVGGCTLGRYAAYSINATDAAHVAAGVKFAKNNNIRLVVKNTGHDFFGRSTGYGSLSIWTHNLKGLEFHDDFKPEGCAASSNGTQKAITISGGHQWLEVYEQANQQGLVVVGGANPTVGCAGGYLQGGGHGWLSHEYGMAVDQVLEFLVVLPSGELVTANACSYSDVFWALRGGGGGTFGIVIKATVKAYASPNATVHLLQITSSLDKPDDFFDAVTYLHSQLPRLSDGGMAGYYSLYLMPGYAFMGWHFVAYNKPNGTAEALFKPVSDKLTSTWNQTVPLLHGFINYPTFFDAYLPHITPEAVGSNSAMGSRLLPRATLEDDTAALKELLMKVTPAAGEGSIIGHLVAGGQVAKNKDLDVSLNPAWREAYVSMLSIEGWSSNSTKADVKKIRKDMTQNKVQAMREATPGSGAYINEADPFEPEWQTTFFGKNYDELYKIKQKYDPTGVMYCWHCVGSEMWAEKNNGELCLV